jgi:hypothetical protein
MDSKCLPKLLLGVLLALCLTLPLSGCFWWDDDTPTYTPPPPSPPQDKGYDDDAITNYWYPTQVTADNMPDPIKKQKMLEDDLVACGYEVRDHRRWAAADDPVSNSQGDVVDHHGVNRSDTDLPDTFELTECMTDKGWVRLKHYYTAPY